MNSKTNNILFIISIVFSLWFAATGIFWVYWFNLIFSYPFGIIALLIWLRIRKDGKHRNKIIPAILIVGVLLSVGMLLAIK